MTFDGKVRNLGLQEISCVLKIDSPLPEDHRPNTLSTADSLRHHCRQPHAAAARGHVFLSAGIEMNTVRSIKSVAVTVEI
jgi:hypothetical protein